MIAYTGGSAATSAALTQPWRSIVRVTTLPRVGGTTSLSKREGEVCMAKRKQQAKAEEDKRYIFCGGRPVTREHVLPRWVGNVLREGWSLPARWSGPCQVAAHDSRDHPRPAA